MAKRKRRTTMETLLYNKFRREGYSHAEAERMAKLNAPYYERGRKRNPSLGLPRNKWVNARIRVTSGGKIQATVSENVLGGVKGLFGGRGKRKRNPVPHGRFLVMAGPHIQLSASTLKGAKKLVAGLRSRGMVYGRLVTIYDEQLKRIVWEKEY